MRQKRNRAAGIVVLHPKTNKVLLLYRTQYRHWEYSKGRIEKGETEKQAARRELREEVNIKKIILVPNFKVRIKYSFKAEGLTILRSVVYFLGYSGDRIRLSDEHSAYRWCTFSEARKRFRHRNYKNIIGKIEKYLAVKSVEA